jgi:hypothetical protein
MFVTKEILLYFSDELVDLSSKVTKFAFASLLFAKASLPVSLFEIFEPFDFLEC